MKYSFVFVILFFATLPNVSFLRSLSPGQRRTNEEHLPDDRLKIIGGSQVPAGGAPYQVALVDRNGHLLCGGSLIGNRTVLSAAHCTFGKENNPSQFKVRYGTLYRTAGHDVAIHKIIRHPSFSSTTLDYDVAIICLAEPFTPSINAATIPLASLPPAPGAQVTVTGWGRTHAAVDTLPLFLQKATNLTIVEQETCQRHWLTHNITDRMLCAFNRDQSACTGDSGGPMVTRDGHLAGVVSFGSNMCLHPSHPGVYASVAHLKEWIESAMGATEEEAPTSPVGDINNNALLLSLAAFNPILASSLLYSYFTDKWFV